MSLYFFFFNDTATTEIYTLSLHDALPISAVSVTARPSGATSPPPRAGATWTSPAGARSTSTTARPSSRSSSGTSGWRRRRSEEHTSELQSRQYLVCRLLLEKKKIYEYH